MSCYIHGDGTFDLKIHAVVWGGGNLYNLDEIEGEMIFYKTMKKIFFQHEKSAYHLILAISIKLHIYSHFFFDSYLTLQSSIVVIKGSITSPLPSSFVGV